MILLKLLERWSFGGDAIGGDFYVGDPADCVEHNFSEIVVQPVVVKVTSSESEPAAAIFVFRYPHYVLKIASSNGGTGVWGGVVVMVFFGNYIEWRNGGKDRGDAFHIFAETHVEVPLVVNAERVDTIGNGVIGERFEVWSPMRIDGFIELVVAAHPAKESVARFAVDRFDSIVEATYPYAFGLQGVDSPYMVVRYVALSAVAIDNNGIDSFEKFLVGGPAWVFLIVINGSVDFQTAFVEHLR